MSDGAMQPGLLDPETIEAISNGRTNWHQHVRGVINALVINEAATPAGGDVWIKCQLNYLTQPQAESDYPFTADQIDCRIISWLEANHEALGLLALLFNPR